MADDDDDLATAGDGSADVVDCCTRCKPFVRLGGHTGSHRDGVGSLARAEQRAREDDFGTNVAADKALAEFLCLPPALRRQRPQLVRLAGLRLRMTHEEQTHARSLCGGLSEPRARMWSVHVGVRVTVALGSLALLASGVSAATGPTRLGITVWPEGRQAAESHRYTLSCAPARGTVPHPVRACSLLLRIGAAAFAPTPPGTACTEIYGGPAQAHVVGRVGGRRVDAHLRLSNGCEIARWNRVRLVVPR